MLKKWRKRKKEWKESVRDKTEKATEEFLTKVFQKCGINNASERFLDWANKNRKLMFAITMCFLVFVFVFSIVVRPEPGKSEAYEQFKEKANTEEIIQKRSHGVNDLIQVLKLKEELNSIDGSNLSKEDSIKIRDLYNKLKNQVYETN